MFSNDNKLSLTNIEFKKCQWIDGGKHLGILWWKLRLVLLYCYIFISSVTVFSEIWIDCDWLITVFPILYWFSNFIQIFVLLWIRKVFFGEFVSFKLLWKRLVTDMLAHYFQLFPNLLLYANFEKIWFLVFLFHRRIVKV